MGLLLPFLGGGGVTKLEIFGPGGVFGGNFLFEGRGRIFGGNDAPIATSGRRWFAQNVTCLGWRRRGSIGRPLYGSSRRW